MKCNHNEVVVRSLIALGCGLECASETELLLAQKYECPPSKTLFMNPIKPAHHLNTARVLGVSYLAFDSDAELDNIRTHHPDASLLLRIETEEEHGTGVESLSGKFGVTLQEAAALIDRCLALGLDLVGVWYVSSVCP